MLSAVDLEDGCHLALMKLGRKAAQFCAGPTTTVPEGAVSLPRGVVVRSRETSPFSLSIALHRSLRAPWCPGRLHCPTLPLMSWLLDLGCHSGNLAPPMVFFIGRLGGRLFVLPPIPRVISHFQIIGAVGGVGLANRVEWDEGEL
jgi:hypothetical protein